MFDLSTLAEVSAYITVSKGAVSARQEGAEIKWERGNKVAEGVSRPPTLSTCTLHQLDGYYILKIFTGLVTFCSHSRFRQLCYRPIVHVNLFYRIVSYCVCMLRGLRWRRPQLLFDNSRIGDNTMSIINISNICNCARVLWTLAYCGIQNAVQISLVFVYSLVSHGNAFMRHPWMNSNQIKSIYLSTKTDM